MNVDFMNEAFKCAKMAFDLDEVPIGAVIVKRNYLNYDGENGFVNLCRQYDWHVFYVPDHYLDNVYSKNNDLRYLTGKENRGGNSISIVIPGLGGDSLAEMKRTNDLIGRNEETLASLEGLRNELQELLPVMQTIHDGLLEGRDRSKKLEGPLADALTAWCALAIAAKEPFYSEEAADTPEADAALEGPLERPTDKLDDKPINGTGHSTKKATTTPKPAASSKPSTSESPAKKSVVIEPAAKKPASSAKKTESAAKKPASSSSAKKTAAAKKTSSSSAAKKTTAKKTTAAKKSSGSK